MKADTPKEKSLGELLFDVSKEIVKKKDMAKKSAKLNTPTTLREIMEKLDYGLEDKPTTATEIGWEVWGEEKQELYEKAAQSIQEQLKTLDILQDEVKNIDNGHDCYEKNCDYCDQSIRDELRTQLRQAIEEWAK